MKFIGTAVTDAGIVKKVNQDSLTLKIVYSAWGTVCFGVVCDGLGGLSQGEVASANVVLAFDKWFHEEFLTSREAWTGERIKRSWAELIFSMNDRIKEYGKEQEIQLGTTVTAALFLKNEYYVVHIGDTRFYELGRTCRQLTKDQTLVEQEVEQGLLTRQQAQTDSRRNVLLQCVGVTEHLVPSFLHGKTGAHAAYLLCSDGFRHVISKEEIYHGCKAGQNVSQEAMHKNLSRLVELNKQRGERDNISAILIQVGA